jgi:hypothetical protein
MNDRKTQNSCRATTCKIFNPGEGREGVGVKMLVLNHFVPGDDLSITDEMWRADPTTDFDGLLVVGRDLQII